MSICVTAVPRLKKTVCNAGIKDVCFTLVVTSDFQVCNDSDTYYLKIYTDYCLANAN